MPHWVNTWGCLVRFPNCHECQLGFQYPQNRIILLCRLPEPSIWPAPIKKWIHWKSPGMESHFFSDSTFIRPLVASLQLPDEHLQFLSSAPPVFLQVFVTFFSCICWFLHSHLLPSQLQQSVWNCVGIWLMKVAVKFIFHCICINL